MKQKKNKNMLEVDKIRIPKFRINPDLLNIIDFFLASLIISFTLIELQAAIFIILFCIFNLIIFFIILATSSVEI